DGDTPSSSNPTVIEAWTKNVQAITKAAISLRQSTGIRQLLEHILVFGNYLNSASTRAACNAQAYGFRLTTLDMLSETKSSSDRSRSLMHYLMDVIQCRADGMEGLSEEQRLIRACSQLSPTTRRLHTGGQTSPLAGFDWPPEQLRLPFDLVIL